MLPVKRFNDFIIENSNKNSAELATKISNFSPEIAMFLAKYLLTLYLPGTINFSFMIVICSIIEYSKYKFIQELEPKEN